MRTFLPEELTPRQKHQYILGVVNPRPICFASTLDAEARPNLAPYSFFNVFSSSPPVFIFSANTRRDGSNKDTHQNAIATGEVVINLVNYSMARQMAICGVEYDTGINEFEKGGFTPVASEKVKPFRVKESPVQFECKVLEVRSLSKKPGAANLIIAEAVLIHIDDNAFAPDDTIDPQKLDMVGRLGNFNYTRASGNSVFTIKQPPSEIALGFDNLPPDLLKSSVLTGHFLAMLAGVVALPEKKEVLSFARESGLMREATQPGAADPGIIHLRVKDFLEAGQVMNAWKYYLYMTSGDSQ